jgi:hypothetical protein
MSLKTEVPIFFLTVLIYPSRQFIGMASTYPLEMRKRSKGRGVAFIAIRTIKVRYPRYLLVYQL